MSAYYNENDPQAAAWLRELIKSGLIAAGEVDERSIVDVGAADLRGFTQCHWFAGVGGWSHALRLAGWPDDKPAWSASCPCQPFSCAGKQLGYKDERDLWPTFFRLVRECHPSVIFGEQVASAEVIGAAIDADMHQMWCRKTIEGILCELKGGAAHSMQGVRVRNGEGEQAGESRQSQQHIQGMAGQEAGTCADERGKASGEDEGSAIRVGCGGHPEENRDGGMRGNGDSLRSIDSSFLERAISGSDRAGIWLHARQYASGHTGIQRNGERLGRTEDNGGGRGNGRETQASLERLVDEIRGSLEAPSQPEWITRVRTDVESEGYSFGASILGAHSVNAPHIRQRLYWVADSGSGGRAQPIDGGVDQPRGGEAQLAGDRALDWVAQSEGEQPYGSRDTWGGRGELADNGGDGRLADADDPRPQGRGRAELRERAGECTAGTDGDAGLLATLAERGALDPWSASTLIACRDGKARRAQPEIFPLAHGVPGRVGLLRGAGNAIVPQTAAAFIKAFLDTLAE